MCLVLQFGRGHTWCGDLIWSERPPQMRHSYDSYLGVGPISDKTLTFLVDDEGSSISPPPGVDLTTGVFTAPTTKSYLVTLTAQIANSASNSLFSYAQLFILRNKNLESLENYLLVEQNKVGDLRVELDLEKGDTLEVFLGHHKRTKHVFGPSGTIRRHDGFFLEDIRFCIF